LKGNSLALIGGWTELMAEPRGAGLGISNTTRWAEDTQGRAISVALLGFGIGSG